MESVRRLWLVRHGETEGESSIRYHGSNDVPLSDVGREQIRALAPLLDGVAFARIVHSPLSRAAESARILQQELSPAAPLVSDARLREISFGRAEGMTREEIDAAFPTFWRDYERSVVDRFPGGESRAAFAARVGESVRALAADDWVGDLLVVAHRGTVRHAALLPANDAPPEVHGVELGSVTVLRQPRAGARWELEALGLRP